VKLPGGIIKEFGNKCRALCVGFDENDIVPCDTTSCGCPKILDPVCAVGPNGDTLTFPNRCFAVCKGYSPDSLFQCRRNDCICPEIYDPVCVVVNGDTLRFDNACLAECKGYTPRQYFRCGQDTTECGCPRNLDPVCVKVNGELKRFPNACVARCQGFSERDLVPCLRDTSDCVCPLNYAPVCAIGPDGDTLTFTNRCFAACKGYEGNEIFTCERDSIRETCIAGFTVARSDSAASLTVKFVDIAKTLEGTILGWKWDFGDGSSDDSQNPVHTFPRPGLYTVTQYIATSTGCTARFSRVVYVGRDTVAGGRSCQAIFTFTQRPTNPNVIQFKNLSQGSNLSILWEFGDGNTSREPNPTHTYAYNGVFFVRLTVRSGDCTHTMSMVLFIDPSALYDDDCKALFLPVLFVDSLQIAFRNLSSSDAIGFRWDFGDGTTSTEFAPIHTYREKKIYTVTLTITTANGCSNTFRAIINLGTQDFTGNPAYRTLETTGTNDVEVLQQLKLYPNPVKNELNLSFTAPAAGDYQIQIFSLEGKLLQQRRENMLIGNNVLQLPTDQLSAGMYLLRLQSEGQTTSLRFIKQ
jgi:PKD repeat protein